jgi:alkylresorcinol/alkylpyrone synthase
VTLYARAESVNHPSFAPEVIQDTAPFQTIEKQPNPRILGVGTALPPYVLAQKEAQSLTRNLFASSYKDIDRLMSVFDNGQVMTRHLAAPVEWFEADHTWSEKNELYVEKALELGEAAARCALRRAKLEPDAIDAIIFVSTTGVSTPSLDSRLIKRLNLSRHTARIPVWGLGCAGGAAGLARAGDYAKSNPDSRVLLVAAELCSLTFQRGDFSKSNLIATSLFADGAAAVIVGPGSGPELVGSYSTLLDDTEDIMGWDVNDNGLKVRFSKDVPALVGEVMRSNMTEAAQANGLTFDDIKHFVTHPGGLKVLQAYAQTLGLDESALEDSYEVLKNCGNMSSVSVLFVLERFMRRWSQLPGGEIGAVSAMGPGFSVEHAFFRT